LLSRIGYELESAYEMNTVPQIVQIVSLEPVKYEWL
jgi:hypothetical protein